MKIFRLLARDAAEAIINDGFNSWHSRYNGYRFNSCYYDDRLQEAISQLDRLKGCFEKEEINEIFDEAEESYRAEINPQIWALYKNKAQQAESDRPVASIEEDDFCVAF